MVDVVAARAPRGLRLYAIGDVHGCADLLADMHARIDADLTARPVDDFRILHLGDYIDRGPDSRGAVEIALARHRDGRCHCLRGNHEQFLIDCLTGAGADSLDLWLMNGGDATLDSYGVEVASLLGARSAYSVALLGQRLAQAIPPGHRQFFLGLPLLMRIGDYAFVHAGIRPGRALDDQEARDLIWIREPFLADPRLHPAVVIHGHTPVREVEIRLNRIGIDTGAVFGGELTCLVLEDDRKDILARDGVQPLPLPPVTDRNEPGRGDVL